MKSATCIRPRGVPMMRPRVLGRDASGQCAQGRPCVLRASESRPPRESRRLHAAVAQVEGRPGRWDRTGRGAWPSASLSADDAHNNLRFATGSLSGACGSDVARYLLHTLRANGVVDVSEGAVAPQKPLRKRRSRGWSVRMADSSPPWSPGWNVNSDLSWDDGSIHGSASPDPTSSFAGRAGVAANCT